MTKSERAALVVLMCIAWETIPDVAGLDEAMSAVLAVVESKIDKEAASYARIIAALELKTEPWDADLIEIRDAAIRRYRERRTA